MTDATYDGFDRDLAIDHIAKDLRLSASQVRAAVDLLDGGGSIPFVARYRKEATGGLDEIALRAIEDAMTAARDLADRKLTILKTIDSQGLLTPELRQQIESCVDKQVLEDLYLPYKPKRRTRAMIARERGLGPLAEILLRQEQLGQAKSVILRPYVNADLDVPDEAAALQGACDIVAETWSEDQTARGWLARQAWDYGLIVSQVKRGKQEDAKKFEQYLDHREPVKRVPSHRFLAMKRGSDEALLNLSLELDDAAMLRTYEVELSHNPRFEFHQELKTTVKDCYERLLLPATESGVLQTLKERADTEAIEVFAGNLRELLLAPPAGPKVTIGIDPGFRTGCKVAVVDGTGKLIAHTAIYPTPPHNDIAGATRVLHDLIQKYDVQLIAIGNGTASRETDTFVGDALRGSFDNVIKVMVSESGASIYSASELAGREYPDLDLTVRGAISIAHRLQDPLAELVKLDPKSIGVGQYQHDVNQKLLKKCLEREVESCVNSVGVDANLASVSLLAHVAGIGQKLAERIVEYRDQQGRFTNRRELANVPKLGKKAFEQAAGFLRIADGNEPLDNSAVHPESYYVVQKMAKTLQVDVAEFVNQPNLVGRLNAADFVDDRVGLPTVQDILAELARPGRDPRKDFQVVRFDENIKDLNDVQAGMILNGVVTNVTKFGAFVDLGVHQDALIHISQLSNTYIQDPSEVVAVGDLVKVKVLEVDRERRRIAVSRKQVSG